MRLLIVDGDKDMNSIIVRHLLSSGYDVDSCSDAESAKLFIKKSCYDVIILDILLPDESGLDVVRWMRREGINASALFLTALDSVEDRVTGLDAGADDYMTKPFSLEELSARVRALSRRLTENRANIYRVADLTLDIHKRTVRRGGKDIDLSQREFSILEYMIRNAGIILSKEQIEHYIWNYDYIGNSNIIEVYISGLRKKIDTGFDQKLIHTVRSAGYTIKEIRRK